MDVTVDVVLVTQPVTFPSQYLPTPKFEVILLSLYTF